MAKDFYSHYLADRVMFARSKVLAAPDDDTYNLIHIPRNAFITDVWVQILTAYVGGVPQITVGWSGNKETAVIDGFMSNDVVAPKTLGLKRAQRDTLVSFPGKYFFSSSGAITVTVIAGAATTEGTFILACQYVVIS